MKKQTFALLKSNISCAREKMGKASVTGYMGIAKKTGRSVAEDGLSDAWLLARRPQSPARQRRVVCVNWHQKRIHLVNSSIVANGRRGRVGMSGKG